MKKLYVALAAVYIGAGSAGATVVPGDTFTFDIAGFNAASGVGYILGSDFSATFGTTQTFAAAGYNGQAYTITSFETVSAATTTDTFQISTPTNFLTSASVNGTKITALEFDIGNANSGVTFGGVPDPVSLSTPVLAQASAGSITYGTANTVFVLTPSTTLSGDGLSFSAVEGVNTGTTAISSVGVHQFNYSITYANQVATAVPEAASWTMFIGGFALIGGGLRRRRSDAAFV